MTILYSKLADISRPEGDSINPLIKDAVGKGQK